MDRDAGEPQRPGAGGCRPRRRSERAGERAQARGARRVIPLAVSAPFHCPLTKPAQERLTPELRALHGRSEIPVVANVDAEPEHGLVAALPQLTLKRESRRLRADS